MKRTLHKEIRQSFRQSRGRFLSILCLMFLGSFALVGLKVVRPNVEEMLTHFFAEHQVMDLAIISEYGLSRDDQHELNQLEDMTIEYGYFTDVVIEATDTAFRLFSLPKNISHYHLLAGTMPQTPQEIVLNSKYQSHYRIGDTIRFTQKGQAKLLKSTDFTITGFVTSAEILSDTTIGSANAGTGYLEGYGVIGADVFDTDVYTIARIRFDALSKLPPFSKAYQAKLQVLHQQIDALLTDNGELRLKRIQSDAQSEIASAEQEISSAQSKLSSAEIELSKAQSEIDRHQSALHSASIEIANQDETLATAAEQLATAETELYNSKFVLDQVSQQLNDANTTLSQQKTLLDEGFAALATAKNELDSKEALLKTSLETLNTTKAELDAHKKTLDQANSDLTTNETHLNTAMADLQQQIDALVAQGIDPQTVPEIVAAQTTLTEQANTLQTAREEYERNLSHYQTGLSHYQTGLAEYEAGSLQHANGLAEYEANATHLNGKQTLYQQAVETLEANAQAYQIGLSDYQAGMNIFAINQSDYESGHHQLQAAKQTYKDGQSDLNSAQQQLEDETQLFEQKRSEADSNIQEANQEIADAKEALAKLIVPDYHTYTRHTFLTSNGYRMITGSIEGIHSVGDLFPVILYLVAALVTMTTMTRFVNEERTHIGLLKALGYSDNDILKKFTWYGLTAGLIGTLLGIMAGTYLLPAILIDTLYGKMPIPDVPFRFHLGISSLAVISTIICSTLPPLFIARKTLQETPALLLLPKPPAKGATILLERIRPIWRRLTFTQKVTCRNIFRYKQRMLMTIFGVAGSVALLLAGLGITASLNNIVTKQYGNILHYDMIVMLNHSLSSNERKELNQLLRQENIAQHQSIYAKTFTTTVPHSPDTQDITLIVTEAEHLTPFVELRQRQTQQPLLLDDMGVILSEHYATLLNASVQDTVPLTNQHSVTDIPILGIAEFYAGHFMFMTPTGYAQYFGETPTNNAYFITLHTSSPTEIKRLAAQFMSLDAVKNVAQNTDIIEQVEAVVDSLSTSMQILTIVSVFLAIVILYNLTTINVAERIRELSTIKVLGFYDREVTRYIYRETMILSLIGIAFGLIAGKLLHRIMIATISPNNMMFDPEIAHHIYIIPPLVIVLILSVLGAFVHFTLKHVDMLEALKANE